MILSMRRLARGATACALVMMTATARAQVAGPFPDLDAVPADVSVSAIPQVDIFVEDLVLNDGVDAGVTFQGPIGFDHTERLSIRQLEPFAQANFDVFDSALGAGGSPGGGGAVARTAPFDQPLAVGSVVNLTHVRSEEFGIAVTPHTHVILTMDAVAHPKTIAGVLAGSASVSAILKIGGQTFVEQLTDGRRTFTFDFTSGNFELAGTFERAWAAHADFGPATVIPAVPEPSTYLLLLVGLAGLAWRARTARAA